MRIIMFFGSPGSGKTVQKELLYESVVKSGHTCKIVEPGAWVREKVKAMDTVFKRCIADTIKTGKLLSEAFPLSALTEVLFAEEVDIIITDGLGRRLSEARIALKTLKKIPNVKIDVIFLCLSDQDAKERLLSRKREDDLSDSVDRRIKSFHKLTMPVINHLKSDRNVRFVQINPEPAGKPEKVHEQIAEHLNSPFISTADT